MKIRKAEPPEEYSDNAIVQIKQLGNYTQIRHMQKKVYPKTIKISKNNYVYIKTGEVSEYKHYENRSCGKDSVAKTLRSIRDIINTNVINPINCLWVTLTYKENMTDTKRLYNDFRKFIQRFRTYCNKMSKTFEYISVAEPQGRGAWHMHVIFIFNSKTYIPNEDLAKVWKHGFVKVNSINNIDNIGVYLSAYLGDMNIKEMDFNDMKRITGDIKEISSTDKSGNKETKYVIKGGRLHLYPPSFHIMQKSRGIKSPCIFNSTYGNAMQYIKNTNSKKTFERCIELIDEDNIPINKFSYITYKKR